MGTRQSTPLHTYITYESNKQSDELKFNALSEGN